MRGSRALAALALGMGLFLPGVVQAQESPKNEEEQLLEEQESNILDVQMQLFAARQRNDPDEVKRLEKKFKKLQDEHGRFLRSTWRM